MLLQYVESCPSTSDLVKEQFAVRGLTEPLLVCTDAQPEGRGTRGRSWSMQPGQDIAFSLGLPGANHRFEMLLTTLPLGRRGDDLIASRFI